MAVVLRCLWVFGLVYAGDLVSGPFCLDVLFKCGRVACSRKGFYVGFYV